MNEMKDVTPEDMTHNVNADEQTVAMLTHLHGDIDVVVCKDDLKDCISSCSTFLEALFLQCFLDECCKYTVVRFRGDVVSVDKMQDWKNSKEECKISRDLRCDRLDVPCVDKDWCSKHAENLYMTALKMVLRYGLHVLYGC